MCRYLVPREFSAQQFSYVVRKRLKLEKEQALWLFVRGRQVLRGDTSMNVVYDRDKDTDGFLYLVYSGENVFGN